MGGRTFNHGEDVFGGLRRKGKCEELDPEVRERTKIKRSEIAVTEGRFYQRKKKAKSKS